MVTRQMSDLPETFPPPVAKPCRECPWRRDSTWGYLGPHTAQEWVEQAHGEAIIACHMTIKDVEPGGDGDWNHPAMRQCRGAAIFRRNVGKNHRRPDVPSGPHDTETVFATNGEFIDHHTRRGNMERQVSIGGTKEKVVEALGQLLEAAKKGEDASLYVKGNGDATPNLALRFVDEGTPDPDEDWSELLVDFDEVVS